MQQVLRHPDETRLYIPKEEEIHVGWHLCPFHRTQVHKGILVKNTPKRSVVTPRAGVGHVGWHFCPFFRHGACAETTWTKNVPKRSPFTLRVPGSHVGWHFCLFLNATHAQK